MVVGCTDLLEPDDGDRGDDLRPVERIRDRAEGMLALTGRVREVEASLDTARRPS